MSRIIKVSVVPKSKRESVERLAADYLKVRVSAPPEKGRANEAVRKALASFFKISKSGVTLKSGSKGKHKVFIIST